MWPLLITAGGITLMMQALRRTGGVRGVRAVSIIGANIRKVGAELSDGEAVAVVQSHLREGMRFAISIIRDAETRSDRSEYTRRGPRRIGVGGVVPFDAGGAMAAERRVMGVVPGSGRLA